MHYNFLSQQQCQQIEKAIELAEKNCSGEIRVHIDKHCSANVLDDAAHTFARLKMHKTELRNGVLFYIAYADKKFAVIGDKGINARVPDGFWTEVCEALSLKFKNGDFVGGLTDGIQLCGEKLKQFFPYQPNDVNELPNEISFGNMDKK